jgi:uncharacterized protein (TIGR03643 family)
MKIKKKYNLTDDDIDRVIGMAWEDRTPFEAIKYQFNISEAEVIQLMKENMRLNSWKKWRERVQGRKTKHQKLRDQDTQRFKCSRQRTISMNAISKR